MMTGLADTDQAYRLRTELRRYSLVGSFGRFRESVTCVGSTAATGSIPPAGTMIILARPLVAFLARNSHSH